MLSATPLIGQVDDFQDGTTQNWTNGVAPDPVNTPGGQGGASDRFLQISSGAFGGGSKLASFNDTQWIGNYVTAGMTAVEMDLKNASASPESIRIALRSSPGGSATPGYASTTAFPLPADNAWHHAVFVLDSGSLTGVNSPAALSTFLTSVGDFRIVEAASGPALIGDTGNFQVGVDNITAVGQPQLNFQPSSVALPEGNAGPTLFVFDVMLSSVNGATVNYATADGSATTADSDYVAANGILTFAPGQTAKQITVQVNGDVTNEADENFTLSLSGPTNATLGVSAATGTIQNDDLFSTVAGRQIFYNNSAFDGSDVAINAADDSSIATDKTAYLPGAGLAVFTNVSSYNKGINGIMIDLAGGGSHGSIGIADFTFKASPVAGNNTPSGWAAGPGPTTISTRIGAGISGSDRVEIIWGANAVKNQWLEVQVLATANTGLPATDVFFWGSKLGDTGAPSATDFSTVVAGDGGTIIAGLGAGTGITNVRDMDKTNSVTVAGDRGITIANLGTLNRLQIPLAGPFAPVGAGPAVSLSASPATATTGTSSGDSNPGVRNIRDSGVASGLASSRRILNSPGQLPAWVVDRLRMLDLNSGPIADYFQRLHDEGTPRAKAILVKADKIADALGLDDEFLDSLLDDLGLE